MVAPNHNRSLQLATLHRIVQSQSELRPLAITQPTDSRGQSLEPNPCPRQIDPPGQRLVLRKHVQHHLVSLVDIARLSRQRYPPKRPLALAEQRTDIRRHEPRKV